MCMGAVIDRILWKSLPVLQRKEEGLSFLLVTERDSIRMKREVYTNAFKLQKMNGCYKKSDLQIIF